MSTRAALASERSVLSRPALTLAIAGLCLSAGLAACDKQPPATPASTQSQSAPQTKTGSTPAGQPGSRMTTPAQSGLPIEEVKIGGKTFKLERADTDESRQKGLSGRTEIPADGGMLFAFAEPRRLNFVMRDCPIGIDIIFLDPTGRIVAMHKMKPEDPQKASETAEDYERRLRLYPSGYGAQFAIELKEGSLDQLKLRNGDQIKLDLERLKRNAK